MTCHYQESADYNEYRCRLTGAQVESDCASLLLGVCVPRQALRFKLGLNNPNHLKKSEKAIHIEVAASIAGEFDIGYEAVAMQAEERRVAAYLEKDEPPATNTTKAKIQKPRYEQSHKACQRGERR